MRLITFSRAGEQRIGAWINDDHYILDLARASGDSNPAFASMQALIEAGPSALDAARALVDARPEEAVIESDVVRLLAPLPRPIQIRDCLCFPAHLAGCQRVVGKQLIASAPDPAAKRDELEAAGFFDVPKSYFDFPLYYISNSCSVIGSGQDVAWPPYSRFIDYEHEWAAVIGTGGSQIRREEARSHIFGYTLFNDWSARDEQTKVMSAALNLGPGPGKDFANSLGPCIVTSDEIADPYALTMRCSVNGKLVSEGSSSGMHYRFEDLIAYMTRGNALFPGEVICSGTVGGGCSIEAGISISPGDVIEIEMEGIGILRNRVVAAHMNACGQGIDSDLAQTMGKVVKSR